MVTLKDIALWIVATLLLIRSVPNARRIWANQAPDFNSVPGWWPASEAFWRGWVRATPVAIVGFTELLLASIIGQRASLYPEPFNLAGAVVLILTVLFLATLIVFFRVILYNSPRFAVPPELREAPGAVEEWAREKGRGRRTDSEN